MLFAAGFGTRMGDLTRTRPKPLIPVAGRPLIDHALAIVTDAGIARPVVNAHYHADMLKAHLAGTDVRVSHEHPQILDTGGGLRAALPLLGDGPVYTLNTDAVWTGPNPLTTLCNAWNPEIMDALLLLVPKANATGHAGAGDFVIDSGGRLTRGPGPVYTGAQIIKPDGLHQIDQTAFSMMVLWERLIANGRLFGVLHTGGWCDVGSPAGIALAENMLWNAG